MLKVSSFLDCLFRFSNASKIIHWSVINGNEYLTILDYYFRDDFVGRCAGIFLAAVGRRWGAGVVFRGRRQRRNRKGGRGGGARGKEERHLLRPLPLSARNDGRTIVPFHVSRSSPATSTKGPASLQRPGWFSIVGPNLFFGGLPFGCWFRCFDTFVRCRSMATVIGFCDAAPDTGQLGEARGAGRFNGRKTAPGIGRRSEAAVLGCANFPELCCGPFNLFNWAPLHCELALNCYYSVEKKTTDY